LVVGNSDAALYCRREVSGVRLTLVKLGDVRFASLSFLSKGRTEKEIPPVELGVCSVVEVRCGVMPLVCVVAGGHRQPRVGQQLLPVRATEPASTCPARRGRRQRQQQ